MTAASAVVAVVALLGAGTVAAMRWVERRVAANAEMGEEET